jgi:hypothetical protein
MQLRRVDGNGVVRSTLRPLYLRGKSCVLHIRRAAGRGPTMSPTFGVIELSAVRAESLRGYSSCLWAIYFKSKARTFALGLSSVIILSYLIGLILEEPNKQHISTELLREFSVFTVHRDVTLSVALCNRL